MDTVWVGFKVLLIIRNIDFEKKIFIHLILLSFVFQGCNSNEGNATLGGSVVVEDLENTEFRVVTPSSDEVPIEFIKAIQSGETGKVLNLIEKGVDVNVSDSRGFTPLFFALNNYDSFDLLISQGAEVDVIADGGASLLLLALRMNDVRFINKLLESSANPNLGVSLQGKSPIFDAVGLGLDRVKLLVQAGANINAVSENGDTPVMEAVSLLKFDVVDYLLNSGVDINQVNKHGYSLLGRLKAKIKLLDRKHSKYIEAKMIEAYLNNRSAIESNSN